MDQIQAVGQNRDRLQYRRAEHSYRPAPLRLAAHKRSQHDRAEPGGEDKLQQAPVEQTDCVQHRRGEPESAGNGDAGPEDHTGGMWIGDPPVVRPVAPQQGDQNADVETVEPAVKRAPDRAKECLVIGDDRAAGDQVQPEGQGGAGSAPRQCHIEGRAGSVAAAARGRTVPQYRISLRRLATRTR